MKYLNKNKNKSGSYTGPQKTSYENSYALTDEQAQFLVNHNGFVIVTETPDPAIDGSTVTLTANTELWEQWKSQQTDPIDALRRAKEAELSAACNAAIVAGMDVETTQGTEHFSLQETDQINLTTAYNAILSGAQGYPYHADGALCRMFTADEITAISNASIAHKLYHTTLCNHLLTWARRAETEDELNGITYTAEGLPDDLAANMAQVLSAAQNV